MTESPFLGKVREQFADLKQSSLSNDNFLGARSHSSSECLKRTHRLLIKHHMHMLRVSTYHGKIYSDHVFFIPTWMPKRVQDLDLRNDTDCELLSYGAYVYALGCH